MSVKSYVVERCTIQEIRSFVETWHYSKNVNGLISTYCFKLLDRDQMIGASIFGDIAMANVWKKYVDRQSQIIELRRLCCVDDTPKNTESFFIGQCLKWLLKNTDIQKVISYSDMDFGHVGTIYRASNFEHLGMTAKGKVIMYDGRRYHDKCIRTKYKGELKPFAKRIKEALENGQAHYSNTLGKHIYVFDLSKRRKKKHVHIEKIDDENYVQLSLF